MEELANLCTIECKQGSVRAVRFNIDGTYCLTCGADKKIKLWNPHRQLHLKTYGGHANEVLDAAGSCDSSHVVSCSADKSVILWDVSTGQPIRRLRNHAASVSCVKFNEESTMAISGSVDNTVACWDVRTRTNEPVQVLRDAKDAITSIQVTDYEISSTSVDCFVRLYDLRACKVTSDFIGSVITYASLTRDGQCLVVSCSDNTIKLIDKDTGEMLSSYVGHETKDYLMENCIDCKDSSIISGSASGEIWFWDLISGSVLKKLMHEKGKVVASITHHPTQNYLMSACEDKVKLWGPPDVTMDES